MQNQIDEKKKKKKKKGDRCIRIAKRKYDVWPSAYASGAVVKCRQGKIWKGLSEEQLNEMIDEEIIKKYITDFFKKDIKIISIELIGSSALSPDEKVKHDLEKYGKEREDGERDKDIRVVVSGISQEDVERWAFSEESEVLDSEGFDVQLELEKAIEEEKKPDFKKEKESGLHGWFSRQGGKGKSKGWVDCNTCRKDKKTGKKTCKTCGRKEGEKRSKYPACRPKPSDCGSSGKGDEWGKKSKKEALQIDQELLESILSEVLKYLD